MNDTKRIILSRATHARELAEGISDALLNNANAKPFTSLLITAANDIAKHMDVIAKLAEED